MNPETELSFTELNQPKNVIGITGGVGAGKSTVVNYILEHYPVTRISADEVGRDLMEPGFAVYEALVAEYGDTILLSDGRIDRAKLSEIAFESPENQQKINEIEHPIIRQEIVLRILRAKTQTVLLEAALFIEGDLVSLCNDIVYVQADEGTRIRRLMTSRAYTEQKSRQIMALQKDDASFRAIATYVLHNNGEWKETEQSVRLLMDRLIKKGE